MALAEYKKKRSFDKTPEPAGNLKRGAAKRLEFVIQKHHASRLHYDFRLELDGVLKSWAVPKGPSLNPKDKRLAMMVEDHPYEYRKFEGVIPAGNYGAGNVIVWDRGWYELDRQEESWPASLQEGLKKGDLKFILHGEKLNGSFALIKTPHMGENAWLLIKHRDKFAKDVDVTKQDKSVISGHKVDDIDQPDVPGLNQYPKSKIPRNIAPMLATLYKDPFDRNGWLYEIKWDGYRAIASWDGKKAELYSRNGNNFSQKYPEVFNKLGDIGHQFVFDGEIIAADDDGHAHFGWLQNWTSRSQGQLLYYVFDVLWLDGYDLRGAPLITRKAILKQLLKAGGIIRYSDHIKNKGKDFFELAREQRLEGIMAKDAASNYHEGLRSKQWLKVKIHNRQEAVIGGYTEPRGSRKGLGALILGVYEGNSLTYVGHTGGGIPSEMLKPLKHRLDNLARSTSPFINKFKPNAPAHWCQPKLVCEVSFSEWTNDGHMRQPIFVGMRQDKKAKDVRRELPKTTLPARIEATSDGNPPKPDAELKFTHRDKIFFSKTGYTKGDLIEYYQQIAPIMLPYLKNRPHNLLRQPNGVNGESFFQKDMDHQPPDWIKTVAVYSESNKKDINYLVCDSIDSLLYMVQLGSIEINPWNSRVKSLTKPDWIVMDLDPEAIAFDKVVEVAIAARKVLDNLGIESYPKTSGKTGIHIYIPLGAKYDYDQGRQFAELLANMIHAQVPSITSLERSPKKRQKKIYVDYLQNREGQTLAAAYSVRPTAIASVSTPLKWEEVNNRLDPSEFTMKNLQRRLDAVGDLWEPVMGEGINMNNVLTKLGD